MKTKRKNENIILYETKYLYETIYMQHFHQNKISLINKYILYAKECYENLLNTKDTVHLEINFKRNHVKRCKMIK